MYDLFCISFSEPSTDARTMNFIRTAVKLGYKTGWLALREKEDVRIDGVDLFEVKQSHAKRMIVRWLAFIIRAGSVIKGLQTERILASDLYSLPVAGKFENKKFIYDSREVYSGLGTLAGHPLKQKIISAIEKHYVKFIDLIYTSGSRDTEHLKKHLTNDVIYHEIFNLPPYKEPVKSNSLREKFNIPENKKILLYQGAVLPHRGIIPVIRAIKESDDYVLCIIGDGPFMDELKGFIIENDVASKVFFTGKIAYNELHKWTCSADAGLALFEPVSLSYKYSFPNKLFEYIMAEIPVLATDLPAMRDVFENMCFGELVSGDMNTDEILDKLTNIFRNEEKILKTIKHDSGKYSYESQTNEIEKILKIK